MQRQLKTAVKKKLKSVYNHSLFQLVSFMMQFYTLYSSVLMDCWGGYSGIIAPAFLQCHFGCSKPRYILKRDVKRNGNCRINDSVHSITTCLEKIHKTPNCFCGFQHFHLSISNHPLFVFLLSIL